MPAMPNADTGALAREVLDAYEGGGRLSGPFSARFPGFNLDAAYAVEAEYKRLRLGRGRTVTGRKVGYANKAVWRILKLQTLVWAHMYDDTVHFTGGDGAVSLARLRSAKIEPEIVFKLKRPLESAGLDAAAVLDAVEWMAIGFEIIDCPFPNWEFQPADFVAAAGLHAALAVGEPRRVEADLIPSLVEGLPKFKLRLLNGGHLVAEGSGKNSLRSPALCLAELAGAVPQQAGAGGLAAGEIISTGTLTDAQPVVPGEIWRVEVEGLPAANLNLKLAG